MTLKELRRLLEREPRDFDDCEVVVWVPGSRIRFNVNSQRMSRHGDTFLLEGTTEPGVVLTRYEVPR